MQEVGAKTACQMEEAIQLLGPLPSDSQFEGFVHPLSKLSNDLHWDSGDLSPPDS